MYDPTSVISNTMRRERLLVTTRTPYQWQLAVISSRLHLCGREAETVHVLCMPKEVPYAVLWSRSRRLGLETVSRRTNVSSREKLSTSRSRLGLGQLCLVPKTNFRPNCAGHINKTYAVWTGFRRRGFWSPHFILPNICSLSILLLSYSWTSMSSFLSWPQNFQYHRHFYRSFKTWLLQLTVL